MSKNVATLLNAGKLDEAEKLCTALCRRNSGDAEQQVLLAYIKIQLQKYAQAVTCSQRAIKLAPENLDAYRLLAYALHACSRFEEAIEVYQKCLQRTPGDAQVLNNFGNSLLALERWDEAMACYEQALESVPNSPDAMNNIGTALRKMGQPDDAIGKYLQALEIDPEYFVAYCNIGDTLLEIGDTDGAIANYQKSLQLKPGYVSTLQRLTSVLNGRGDYESALEYYRQIITANPDNPDVWFSMGVANGKLDRHERAVFCYQKAIKYAPRSVRALTNLGALLNTLSDYGHAIECLEKALQIKPDNVLATFNLANAWRSKEQFDKAAIFYEKVLELDPDHAEADYQLSIISGAAAPDKPPAEYVATLFDQYAWKFDQHLVGDLAYRTPHTLYSALSRNLATDVRGQVILDIGCGTGLFGELVKEIASRLVGVDLSPGMIEKAQEKEIYDALYVDDAIDFMKRSADKYNVVAAADVLPYLGDLSQIFTACRFVLSEDGLLIFSVESENTIASYVRRQSGRYAHSRDYLSNTLQHSGFEVCSITKGELRKEKDTFIEGYYVVARCAGCDV